MIDIKIHNNYRASIKFQIQVRQLFFDLFQGQNSYLNTFLVLTRPNFRMDEISNDYGKIIFADKNYFELIIKLKKGLSEKILALDWGWKSYESFQILVTNKEITNEHIGVYMKSGRENANFFDGYSIYRGVEKDVLWIEKSDRQKFSGLSKLFP